MEFLYLTFHLKRFEDLRRGTGLYGECYTLPVKALYATYKLDQFSSGLVASINFHPREIEKETGGDFGMVIMCPKILLTTGEESTRFDIRFVYPRGGLRWLSWTPKLRYNCKSGGVNMGVPRKAYEFL
jgi:hypothetical protein